MTKQRKAQEKQKQWHVDWYGKQISSWSWYDNDDYDYNENDDYEDDYDY